MNLVNGAKRRMRLLMGLPVSQAPSDKAAGGDYLGRFREVVSDPLNLLIERDPRAGMIEGGLVWLHNGNRVPFEGKKAYYGRNSDLLVINRGVHEPLEEYVFQELMRVIPQEPTMLELGAYWGHYSMWLKHVRPRAKVTLVEPVKKNIAIGRANFRRNGYEGNFIRSFVSRKGFTVDQFLRERNYPRLDVLHSDIQGYELEMLAGCVESFRRRLVDYVFVSTHGETLHHQVVAALTEAGMRVEISSACREETTSYDGFVFASRPELPPVFPNFSPLGRRQILNSNPEKLVEYLSKTLHERSLATVSEGR
jgi:Methyltransferase FkbM domain